MKDLLLLLLLFGSFTNTVLAQDIPEPPIPELAAKLPAVKSDTARYHLLLAIADAYVLKPGEDPHDLDSAFLLIAQVEKANHDPYIHDLLFLIRARALREKGDQAKGRANALQALEAFRAKKNNYPLELAYAANEAATYLDYNDPKEDSQRIDLYREAAPLFERTGHKERWAETLKIMGDCLIASNRQVEALGPLHESEKFWLSMPHADLRDLYSLLSIAYKSIGDFRNALKYGLQGLASEQQLAPSANHYLIYDRLGLVYQNMEKLDSAASWFHQALAEAEKFHDTSSIIQAVIDWARALTWKQQYDSARRTLDDYARRYPFTELNNKVLLLDAYASLYRRQNRLSLASPYIRQLMSIDSAEKPETTIGRFCEFAIVKYLLAAKQYDQARQYAVRLRDFCIRHHQLTLLADTYSYLFQADSAQGRLGQAITEYQQYVRLRDSILDARKARQIAALQLEFDMDKKDRDIQSLLHRQQLSTLALNQAGVTRNFIIAAAILLFVLLAVSINRYRLKQRSNKQLNRLLTEKEGLLTEKEGLLTEKEWLLKEIHHRVKNNLQIGISLLNLQSHYIDNEKAQAAIRESRSRMHAMSLIHQRLYQADNLKSIDMRQYIPQLIECIRDSYAGEKDIHFQFRILPLEFDVKQALPIGLIINETVTNSLKYAFPNRRNGRIAIGLENVGDSIFLTVADNGVGIATGSDPLGGQSMGMQLINILVQQLDGSIQLANQDGLTINIRFPTPSPAASPAPDSHKLNPIRNLTPHYL